MQTLDWIGKLAVVRRQVSILSHHVMKHSSGLRTERLEFSGESVAMLIATKLVNASQWFSLLPLPDDRWEIEVKAENSGLLHSWLESSQA